MYIITFIEILSNGLSLLYTDECVQDAFLIALSMCGGISGGVIVSGSVCVWSVGAVTAQHTSF